SSRAGVRRPCRRRSRSRGDEYRSCRGCQGWTWAEDSTTGKSEHEGPPRCHFPGFSDPLLGFGPERGHALARRGAERPPVLTAELGRALVADAERGLGGVEPLAQHEPPGL